MALEKRYVDCTACGGELKEKEGSNGKILQCCYCGSEYRNEQAIPEDVVIALNRANSFRNRLAFDEAQEEYDLILKSNPEIAEANWGALLCEYGIIYEKDYDEKYKPTCHRLNDRRVESSRYYPYLSDDKKARAQEIETLRKDILSKTKGIKPYDVFICYKQTEEKHGMAVPTKEAGWARDIYEMLTHELGLRVFFAEKSLAGSNVDYEPHIYSALRSAKMMLVLAASIEHVNAVWVQNEWKRYAKYIREGENKTLRVIYDNIDPYNLPKELQNKQAISHDQMGWDKAIKAAVKELFVDEKAEQKKKEEAERRKAEQQKREEEERRKESQRAASAPIASPTPTISGGMGKKVGILAACVVAGVVAIAAGIGIFGNNVVTEEEYSEVLLNSSAVIGEGEWKSDGDFAYQRLSDGYAVCLAENTVVSGELEIPSEYDGLMVTAIPDGAFKNSTKLTSVIVPDTVQTIGLGAFEGCTNLKSYKAPFTGKSEDATASEGVLGYVFGYTTQEGNLGQPSLAFSNTQVGEVEGATWQYTCYDGTKDKFGSGRYALQSYFYYIPNSLKVVTITNETSVKDAAFNGCKNIEEVYYEIPFTTPGKTLEQINVAAFQNCKKLSRFNTSENMLNLEVGVTEIGEKAFFNCSEIEYIAFDATLTKIGDFAFADCSNVKELSFPGDLQIIGEYAFQNMPLVTSLYVPGEMESIGKGAFQGWNKLQEITLPFTGKSEESTSSEGVLGYIFGYATQEENLGTYGTEFVNTQVGEVEGATWQYTCYDGTKDVFGSGRYALQSYFYYIPKTLKTVRITNEASVKEAAFNGCSSITDIGYEKTLKKINAAAFQNCKRLSFFNLYIDNMLNLQGAITEIGEKAFYNCSTIESIVFDSSLMKIGNSAFAGCSNIKALELPENLEVIGEYAFQNMSLITSVNVPQNVYSIGQGAFQNCNKLQEIILPFTGKSEDATASEGVFGYIFGYTTQEGNLGTYGTEFVNTKVGEVDDATWQYTCYDGTKDVFGSGRYALQSYYYYIPKTLKSVTITNETVVKEAAFNGCSNLESIVYEKEITSQGEYSFQNCSATLENGIL